VKILQKVLGGATFLTHTVYVNLRVLLFVFCTQYIIHCVQKNDAKIQITITTAHLVKINYPLSSFNYRLFGTNVENYNKIHHMVSEQQLFKN